MLEEVKAYAGHSKRGNPNDHPAVSGLLLNPVDISLRPGSDVRCVGLIGIQVQETADANGVSVIEVAADSAAQRAGIEIGDVIDSFASKEVTDMRSLRAILMTLEPEKEYPVSIRRGEE